MMINLAEGLVNVSVFPWKSVFFVSLFEGLDRASQNLVCRKITVQMVIVWVYPFEAKR
jgi:hypothetical protein